jgi:predicted enzyme related to lactoylglutathione lyase
MGRPVVHFEIMGTDAAKLHAFYSSLFDWKINAENPLGYGIVEREANLNPDGIGIGGGVAAMPEGMPGFVTFYVEVPDVEAALAQAEQLGGQRVMGPETPMEGLEIGLFADPEGHMVGLVRAAAV